MSIKELILKRVEEIRKHENGFPKGVQKWANFSTGTDTRHISEIDFSLLDDTSLVLLFERLVKRYYTQM
jgi:hypothetical protein